MPSILKSSLHKHIAASVGNNLTSYGPLIEIPFRLTLADLGEIAFYAFTLTSPVGGRPIGEYKIQLIVPNQERGDRGYLEYPPGAFTIVAGWSPDEDIFVLWDAYAHRTFAYSQNLQVKGEAIWTARIDGLATCDRHLRNERGLETVVVCRPDKLVGGIQKRIEYSAQRLTLESSHL